MFILRLTYLAILPVAAGVLRGAILTSVICRCRFEYVFERGIKVRAGSRERVKDGC